MARLMKMAAVGTVVAAACFSLLYSYLHVGLFLTLAITFGTIAYHFCMRLFIGLLYNAFMHNKADYTKRWFRVGCIEQKLYRMIKVKHWKNKMPTYDAEVFNPSVHSWDEIAQAMCQSELVHETIIVFSFLPVAASAWFGELAVFLITSVAAALVDLLFVIMQRYNRPRVLRLVKR